MKPAHLLLLITGFTTTAVGVGIDGAFGTFSIVFGIVCFVLVLIMSATRSTEPTQAPDTDTSEAGPIPAEPSPAEPSPQTTADERTKHDD